MNKRQKEVQLTHCDIMGYKEREGTQVTVSVLIPNTTDMIKWIKANIVYEPWQQMSRGIAIEHRCFDEIICAVKNAGFVESKDFSIL
jgi:hypothetical protein